MIQPQADKDREATLVDSAITTLGSTAGVLPWLQYRQLLGVYLRRLNRGDVEHAKVCWVVW